MAVWQLIDTALVPGSRSELRLRQREQEFSIEIGGDELMNSRVHESEDRFAQLGCALVSGRTRPRVLIGGLGMGYSLRAALESLPADAEVSVAELVPEVVVWNRERLGHLADHPLRDARVTLHVIDVAELLRQPNAGYDLVLLDVDNGPEGLTRAQNDWLYGAAGLSVCRAALRPEGSLGFWSSGRADEFVQRLQASGFAVTETTVPAAAGCYGIEHTMWFARVAP
jgi:spermidine synthase